MDALIQTEHAAAIDALAMLVDQIAGAGFVDPHGHHAEQMAAYQEARRALERLHVEPRSARGRLPTPPSLRDGA